MDWNSEFDRQLTNLIAKNYPEAAHLSEAQFRAHCEPLKEQLTGLELPELILSSAGAGKAIRTRGWDRPVVVRVLGSKDSST